MDFWAQAVLDPRFQDQGRFVHGEETLVAKHIHKFRQARDVHENDQRLEAKALAKLADLPAQTRDATGAEAGRKRAVIEAALARARARRDNG